MKDLWIFFENLNEVVYVSDMDTYEMIYMNRKAREIYGFESSSSMIGRKCYEILCRCSCPCTTCTNAKLEPNKFYEWKYHNPILNKTFALKETILLQDGKRYRLIISIDITVQEKQQLIIKEFSNSEAMINDALRLSLSASSPEKSLTVLLQHLGESLKGDRIYIFEETPDHHYRNTYEWCAHDISPQKDWLQHVPYEVVKFWFDYFHRDQNIVIKDVDSIRESDPLIYEYLIPQNIHSLIACPLVFNQKIFGFYGIDNPPLEHLHHISTMFQVLSHFIVSIIRRRDLVKRLENMSYYDQLTGALNRHAMNKFIAHVDHTKSIGLIYCDVMGLKKVNDNCGHLKGDDLLIRTNECLKKVFPLDAIYRIGGDEFLIMQSDIPQETLLLQIQTLRKKMPAYSVSMALGHSWRPSCNGQIINLLKEADALMYEDKRHYYQQTSNDRRQPKEKPLNVEI